MNMEFSKSLSDNLERLKQVLQADKNFDIVYRVFEIADRKAALFFVDGFTKDEVLLKMMQSWWSIKKEDMPEDAHGFSKVSSLWGDRVSKKRRRHAGAAFDWNQLPVY